MRCHFWSVRLLSCVLLTISATALAADRKAYSMDIPADGVRTISFAVEEGDFVLRGDPNSHAVRIQVSIDRLWIFKLGEENILKRLIKVHGQGTDHLNIATDIPRSLANWGRAQYPIDFEVVVPASAKLEVRDTSGIIRISGLEADVSVDDGTGTLTVSNLRSSLRINKTSGDISVADISGAVQIGSRSGQIQCRRLGALNIESSDGNVDISNVSSAVIHNRRGNIRVSEVKDDLQIGDESGEIIVNKVGGNVHILDTSGQIRLWDTGNIEIADTSGDVTVHQAASLRITHKESGQVKVAGVRGAIEVPPGITLKR